jgi:hypothetical protein
MQYNVSETDLLLTSGEMKEKDSVVPLKKSYSESLLQ